MSRQAHRLLRVTPSSFFANVIYRIACGQDVTVADTTPPPWNADRGYSSTAVSHSASTTTPIDISGVQQPAPMSIYQNERWTDGTLTYTFSSLKASTLYRVRLHFAEVYYTAATQRLINIAINGTMQVTGYDIFAKAGGMNRAVIQELAATADANGTIIITMTASSAGNDPKICGIELSGNITKDDTPLNLASPTVSGTYAVLTWDPPMFPTGRISGYNIYQNGVKINAATVTTNTFQPGKDSPALSLSTTYTFSVKSIINGIEQKGADIAVKTNASTNQIFIPGVRIKVMAIGDSTTEAINGSTHGLCPGYRGPLWTRLNNAGYLTQAVGPNSDTSNGVPIVDGYHDRHAGNSGWELRRMRDNVITWMKQPGQMPDVVLVVGGNNSMTHSPQATPQQAADEMRGLVSNIYSVNPQAVVFISTDTPNAPAASSNLVQYVALVPGIVNEFRAMGKKAFFVDSFGVVPQTYEALPDGGHPTLYWYDKLAENWFKEITAADRGEDYP